ncbi:MAG: DNA recombination protein RmuC [Myxococcota bacterium]|nr:DNA recombination protein RmuC [Myxococcota bacterium]
MQLEQIGEWLRSDVGVVWVLAMGCVSLLFALCVGLVARARTRTRLADELESLSREIERSHAVLREELARARSESGQGSHQLRLELTGSLHHLGEGVDKRLEDLRTSVDNRLHGLQDESRRNLEAVRQVVEEKLQGTLEERLGKAFRQVSERLEAVHQGLGEMQHLAASVGSLEKVLSNVKTRGTWGEVQLGAILSQLLAPGQYAANVAVKRGSAERVDYAVRLPGAQAADGADDEPVWLPIDAKFPQEDLLRLVEASERGDPEAVESAARALETRVRQEARRIRDKYLNPPRTTDFALLFLPTESLYAEVMRRPGLVERLQRECRVTVAGPTTLAALLSSLQMGFRTLAIQRRSSEVWKLLGSVKGQLAQFHELLEKVSRKLEEASHTVGEASRRSQTIHKRLGRVEALPAEVGDEEPVAQPGAGAGPGEAGSSEPGSGDRPGPGPGPVA